jgi:hypothetical protein
MLRIYSFSPSAKPHRLRRFCKYWYELVRVAVINPLVFFLSGLSIEKQLLRSLCTVAAHSCFRQRGRISLPGSFFGSFFEKQKRTTACCRREVQSII